MRDKNRKKLYDAARYLTHKKLRYEQQKAWRKANPSKVKRASANRYARPEPRLKSILSSCKARAKDKGISYNLNFEWVWNKWERGCCEVTGIEFSLDIPRPRVTGNYAPSIDRMDSTKGYTKDNCRLVIWMYNAAKGVGTDEDVRRMARGLL